MTVLRVEKLRIQTADDPGVKGILSLLPMHEALILSTLLFLLCFAVLGCATPTNQPVNRSTIPNSPISNKNESVLYVDSQETRCYNGAATNAIDGDTRTIWHSQMCDGSAPPPPHQITINMGASYTVTAFEYVPRQDGSACGWINQYEFYVSTDGTHWGNPVAAGTFNYGNLSKKCPGPGAGVPGPLQVAFPPTTGQYVRLRALSEVNGNPWITAADIHVLGGPPTAKSARLPSSAFEPGQDGGRWFSTRKK